MNRDVLDRLMKGLPYSLRIAYYKDFYIVVNKYPELLDKIDPACFQRAVNSTHGSMSLLQIIYDYGVQKCGAIAKIKELREEKDRLDKDLTNLKLNIDMIKVIEGYIKILNNSLAGGGEDIDATVKMIKGMEEETIVMSKGVEDLKKILPGTIIANFASRDAFCQSASRVYNSIISKASLDACKELLETIKKISFPVEFDPHMIVAIKFYNYKKEFEDKHKKVQRIIEEDPDIKRIDSDIEKEIQSIKSNNIKRDKLVKFYETMEEEKKIFDELLKTCEGPKTDVEQKYKAVDKKREEQIDKLLELDKAILESQEHKTLLNTERLSKVDEINLRGDNKEIVKEWKNLQTNLSSILTTPDGLSKAHNELMERVEELKKINNECFELESKKILFGDSEVMSGGSKGYKYVLMKK